MYLLRILLYIVIYLTRIKNLHLTIRMRRLKIPQCFDDVSQLKSICANTCMIINDDDKQGLEQYL